MIVWSLPGAAVAILIGALAAWTAANLGGDFSAAPILAQALNLLMIGFVFLYLFVLFFVFYIPAFGLLSEGRSVREALKPSNVLPIFRRNPGGIMAAMALGWGVTFLLSGIGLFLCLVGAFPGLVLAYALEGQFFGNAYRDAAD